MSETRDHGHTEGLGAKMQGQFFSYQMWKFTSFIFPKRIIGELSDVNLKIPKNICDVKMEFSTR